MRACEILEGILDLLYLFWKNKQLIRAVFFLSVFETALKPIQSWLWIRVEEMKSYAFAWEERKPQTEVVPIKPVVIQSACDEHFVLGERIG